MPGLKFANIARLWTLSCGLALGISVAVVGLEGSGPAQASEMGLKKIRLPENFRTDLEFLGAWAVAGDADTGGAIGQHIVYASPGTIEAFRKTGAFPDGAVLVKELFKGKTEDLTTGSATSAAEVAGYFVMIKDQEGKGQGALWGDGWGWAFFNPDDGENTVTKDYQEECLGCHEPVRESDLVYSYAYPVLNQ